ncbi:hypothetical protein AALO_G00080250, partial [Alosa alosa]
ERGGLYVIALSIELVYLVCTAASFITCGSSEQQAAFLLDLGRLRAKHSTNGLIKHRL